MLNLLEILLIIVIGFLLLKIAYNLLLAGAYYIKYIYLRSDHKVVRGHNSLKVNRDSVQFIIEGTSSQNTEGQKPFVVQRPIVHTIEESVIETASSSEYVPEVGEEGFVMPTTPEEWRKYDEPTYVRLGKFLS